MEAVTRAREWQEEAKRLHDQKFLESAEAEAVYNDAIQCTFEKTEALEKLQKLWDSLAITEETQRDLNELQARLCQTHHTMRNVPCVFSIAEAMCEFHARTLSESDEEELHRNIPNVFLVLVIRFHIGAALVASLTEEETGQVGMSCHFALDCPV